MTPDPYWRGAALQNPGSWNRYGYVVGDPTNSVDPSGLCVIDGVTHTDGGPDCPDVTGVTVTDTFDPLLYNFFSNLGAPGDAGSDEYGGRPGPWDQTGKNQYVKDVRAWEACRDQVKQQQNAPAQHVLDWLEQNYLQFIGAGGAIMGVIGGIAGTPADFLSGPGGNVLGAFLGMHIGMLGGEAWHTQFVILFNILANLPPLASSVEAACGPPPGN